MPDLKTGSYVKLLDEKLYYVAKPIKSSRHRLADNLLGNIEYAPLLRKTSTLESFIDKKLELQAAKIIEEIDYQLISRALHYLYTKETMSSWEIEREQPDSARLTKFVKLLENIRSFGALSKEMLIKLQKMTIDTRFAIDDYRDFQNYVGEEITFDKMIIHYIAPKPEDIQSIMEGIFYSYKRMAQAKIHPVLIAGALSFGFVFAHPFEDGNGRIHRFLIHYVLALFGFTPKDLVLPISALMLKNIKDYDGILESFSKPLMQFVDYKCEKNGALKVLNETKDFYAYLDYTSICEYLFDCIEKTIEHDFKAELDFLTQYDKIKTLCRDIVDMPDQKLDLFIKCVRQNQGKLAARKREKHFSMLTDSEIAQMEKIISSN